MARELGAHDRPRRVRRLSGECDRSLRRYGRCTSALGDGDGIEVFTQAYRAVLCIKQITEQISQCEVLTLSVVYAYGYAPPCLDLTEAWIWQTARSLPVPRLP